MDATETHASKTPSRTNGKKDRRSKITLPELRSAIGAGKPPEVDHQDHGASVQRLARLKERQGRMDRIGQLAEREVLARLLEEEGRPVDPMQDGRMKRAGLHDPMHRLYLNDEEPDSAIHGIRSAEGKVTLLGAKRLETPLDYLRHRSRNPISSIQYEAGLRYATAIHDLQRTGSNTQAILNNAVYSVPVSNEERDAKALGHEMTAKGGLHPARDPSDAILGAVARLKMIEARLDKFDRVILRHLLGNERTVGQIASTWGCPVEAMGWMIRKALLSLVDALLVVDRDFYLFREQMRVG